MKQRIFKHIAIAIVALSSVTLQSCFTGIESTKQISLSKEDKKLTAPTPEELFLKGIAPSRNAEWKEGKVFVVVGERATSLFEPRRIGSGKYSLSEGDSLIYERSRMLTLPDGNKVVSLLFLRGEDEFGYVPQIASESVLSDAMPGIVDLEMVGEVGRLLDGKELWTRTSLWSNAAGEKVNGRKYEKVSVKSVSKGNETFPVRVNFVDETGGESSIFINFDNSGSNSRSFANMFSLTDPHLNYKEVSSAVWERIRRGEVAEGMTKEECRLSRGNPTEVNTGHDYSHVLLIWGYPDGSVLYFVDGILKGINQPPKTY